MGSRFCHLEPYPNPSGVFHSELLLMLEYFQYLLNSKEEIARLQEVHPNPLFVIKEVLRNRKLSDEDMSRIM
jgi:hypothetical protein